MSKPEPQTFGRAEGTAHWLPRPDSRDHEVWQEVWEQDAYRFTRDQIGFSGVVIDVGANVGAFSLLAAVAGATRVLAIEPDPANLAALNESLTWNEVGHAGVIQPIECGLWYREGFGTIVAEPGTADAVLAEDDDHGKVKLYTLTDIFDQWGIRAVDVLKVDVEGAEANVIAGASDDVLWSVRRLVMEFHGDAILGDRPAPPDDAMGKMLVRLGDFFRLETFGRTSVGGLLVGERW